MLIENMTRQASLELLARARLGRLACEHDGQPYITPVTFACDGNHLYAFSTLGQKIVWMRANPRVCLEADEMATREDWASVIVIGHYEELTGELDVLRNHAYNLLQRNALWWEPGYVKTILDGAERPISEPVYYRIHIDQISGHRGVPDIVGRQKSADSAPAPSWLQRIFGRPENQ